MPGLDELVTRTLADYQALAQRLAADPAHLATLRARLRRSRQRYFDTDRYRRHLEGAYQTMWRRHQAQLPAASFTVEAVADSS